jgi:hypothetical protein
VSTLPIPKIFSRPPRDRSKEDMKEVKDLCDRYYRNPPVTFSEILNSHLHMIYIINVDKGKVKEMDVDTYFEAIEGMASSAFLD